MARQRAVAVFGQSNCDGKAAVSALPSLAASRWQSLGVYQNLHFWQNDPFDFHSNRGRITPLDLSFYDDAAVASENYRYIANKSYLTVTDVVPSAFGPELEIARGFAEEMGTDPDTGRPPITVKLGIDATFISPYEPVLLPFPNSDWWWPTWQRSWHPGYPKVPTAPVLFGSAVHTGVATSTTSSSLTQTGAGWGVNAYTARWVRATWTAGYSNNVLSATALIASNTADTLTVALWLGPTPPSGADPVVNFSIYPGTVNVLGTIDVKVSGTATGIAGAIPASVLTDAGAFVAGAHVGHWAIVGGAIGYISANTTDELTIQFWAPSVQAGTMGSVAYQVADIRPGAGSFAKLLIEDYVGACNTALVAEGHQIDVQDIFGIIGESDAGELIRAQRAGDNMRAIITYMRDRLVALGYTTLPANKIRVTLALVKENAIWTYATTVNEAYRALADSDPYISVVDTNSFSYGGATGSDTAHFDAQGQLDLGRALYESNKELREREGQATVGANYRLTLADLRTRFRRRYERTTSSAELTNPQVDSYLNDALRHLYNVAGDNAWFLRQIDTVTISGSPGQTTTLPSHIRRVYRVEKTTEPGLDLPNFVVGYSNEGRTQLVLPQHAAGTYNIHHFLYPLDLSADEDKCVVPPEYVELVILYACKRAAETAGNVDHAAIFNVEVAMLEQVMKRDLVRYDRPRKPAVTSRYEAEPFGPMSLRTWERGFDRY